MEYIKVGENYINFNNVVSFEFDNGVTKVYGVDGVVYLAVGDYTKDLNKMLECRRGDAK